MDPMHAKVVAAMRQIQGACGSQDINQFMAAAFTDLFRTNGMPSGASSPGGLWVSAMQTGFYSGSAPAQLVQREVAVLAVLTAQGADVNLALHVFIALAVGLSPQEVLDVILLAGMYSGANLFSHAMKVATKAFAAIVDAGASGAKSVGDVVKHIGARFPDAELDQAKKILA